MMSPEGIDRCLEILQKYPEISILDITGGAPELHPEFQRFVRGARHDGQARDGQTQSDRDARSRIP